MEGHRGDRMKEKPRVLIVDDDVVLAEAVRKHLTVAGYQVSTATDGILGLSMMHAERPDLVVLDTEMPKLDGWETCCRIREVSTVPVIMISATAHEASRVRGLRLGADDYIIKPFSFKELEIRIHAALRRAYGWLSRDTTTTFTDDRLLVRLPFHEVRVKGKKVDLTPIEHRLLAHLILSKGAVLTYAQLLERVWGHSNGSDRDLVRVHVCRLRRKIEQDHQRPNYIRTSRGIGYRFEPAY